MKKIKKYSYALVASMLSLLMIASTGAMALGFDNSGFTYERYTYGAVVKGYSVDSPLKGTGTLNIPANMDGNIVVGIEQNAFTKDATIEKVILPASLQFIEENVFQDDTGIHTVNIPVGLQRLGSAVFNRCSSLETVIFDGNALTEIGSFAFAYCEKLNDVTLPSAVKSIGDYAFAGDTSLKNIYIPPSVTKFGYLPFYNSHDVTIFGISGSRAEEYARSQSITFVATDKLNKNNLYVALINGKPKLDGDTSIYTEKSLKALQSAYDEAKSVYDYKFSIQGQIDTAAQNLIDAISGLTVKADKTKLYIALNDMQSIMGGDVTKYVPETYSALVNAYNNGRLVYDSEEATQEIVNQTAEKCNAAIDGLVIKSGDETPQEVLAKAKDILDNKSHEFTGDSIAQLQKAYDTNSAVINSETATYAEKEEAAANLNTAIRNLMARADISELTEIIANAENILTNDKSKYTEETINVLQTAYDNGVTAAADTNVLQAKVNICVQNIQTAIDGLILQPKKMKRGDSNLDGRITMADVVVIQKHISKLITLTDDNFRAGDYDRDGIINMKDCVYVQKTVAKIIPEIED
ncbi:MAG TPA: leucine-rich repeat protein [Clostridiales bacterium]|nr:leucine-rich repeat protein [Clostridiales bacterium]